MNYGYLTFATVISLISTAVVYAGSESGGGGHLVTKCNGSTVLLDEYRIEEDEIPIHITDDPRFKDAAQFMTDSIAKIRIMHPTFGESLQRTYEHMFWRETCHALESTNDQNFPTNGQKLSIDQIAVEKTSWNNTIVLISIPEFNKISHSPMTVRFLVLHETLKAYFGQDMDRPTLRAMVKALANNPQKFSSFDDAVNSINKYILQDKVEIKVICENCSEVLEKQVGTSAYQRFLVDFNYGDLGEWKIDLREPSRSFIVDRKESNQLVSLTTSVATIGVPFPPNELILAIYSNGHFVWRIEMPIGARTSNFRLFNY